MGGLGSGPGLVYADNHPRTVEMVKMWEGGVKTSDIAARFGLSRRGVEAFMARRRHLFKKRRRPVTDDEVAKIWTLYGDGYSIYAIAKTLNRSDTLVTRVLSE